MESIDGKNVLVTGGSSGTGQAIAVEQYIPMRWAGTTEETVAVTMFFCPDEAVSSTGQTLFVESGLTLSPDFREPWSSQ